VLDCVQRLFSAGQLRLEFGHACSEYCPFRDERLVVLREMHTGRHLMLGERHQLDDAVAQRLVLRGELLAQLDELCDEIVGRRRRHVEKGTPTT